MSFREKSPLHPKDIGDKVTEHLSDGWKRLISVGAAFLGNPKFVILDEPSVGMDPQNRKNFWGFLLKNRGRRAILLTTHLMDEADLLADRVGILRDGKLRTYGSPAYLKTIFGTGFCLNVMLRSRKVWSHGTY